MLGNIFGLPRVTKNLLVINIAVWVCCLLSNNNMLLVDFFGLHCIQSDNFFFYQLITYMFVHKTISHMFFNMFALFMFGGALEKMWGERRFIIYYIITGIGAGIVQLLVYYFLYRNLSIISDSCVIIGASGAIFGLLLAFGVFFPDVPIYLMFIPIPIKSKYFVVGYGIVEFFCGVFNCVWKLRGLVRDNTAHFAHLGGMLFGIFLIFYWKRRN
ncbi:MAG: rhomboid family intramembrane serine protease [Bacteroidales bacterium OttesenSCG-928-I14]|jgi:membrane associated rhomboid family serine protease|nr:rhomboid family intramembrane serine protease [Bacteroidales bacterium OttesenSCG-928-I14]